MLTDGLLLLLLLLPWRASAVCSDHAVSDNQTSIMCGRDETRICQFVVVYRAN